MSKSSDCRVLLTESDIRQFLDNPSSFPLSVNQIDSMKGGDGISQSNSSPQENAKIQSGGQEDGFDEQVTINSTHSGETNDYHNTSLPSHSRSPSRPRSRSYSRTPEREYERDRSVSRSRSRSRSRSGKND